MAKASIHFSPIQSNSEAHNERSTKLDYNFPELEKNNESFVLERVATREKAINSYCKKVSGRKLQKNAEPIREAVVNLNSHHTMADLKRLATVLKEKKGIDCFQIHIHRDEGKSRDELNYHAHMIFDWQDKATGKTLKLNRADLSQIQDLVAETLEMQRGELRVNSNRERLESIEYKRQQEELRAKEAEIRAKEAREKTKAQEKVLSDIVSDLNVLEGKKKQLFNEASSVIVKKDKLGIFKAIDESSTILNVSGLLQQNKALRNELLDHKRESGNKIKGLAGEINDLRRELKDERELVKQFRAWTEYLAKINILGKKIGPENMETLKRMFSSIADMITPKAQEKKPEISPKNKSDKKKRNEMGF